MIDEKLLIKDIHTYFHTMIDRMHETEIDKDVLTLNKDICGIIENQPKADWIPCEERLPEEENEDYLICQENGIMMICMWSKKGWNTFKDSCGKYHANARIKNVVAWQPIQPYKKEGAE